MTDFNEYIPVVGPFIARGTTDGRTIFSGTIPGDYVEGDKDQIWVMEFVVTEVRKFKMPKHLEGMTISQIMSHSMKLSELEEIQ